VVQPYQDPSNSVESRVEDLLARLSVQDKAGLMFHDIIAMGPGGQLISSDNPFGRPATEAAIRDMAAQPLQPGRTGGRRTRAGGVAQPRTGASARDRARYPGNAINRSPARVQQQSGHRGSSRCVLTVAAVARLCGPW
jgi:hypothetical protein